MKTEETEDGEWCEEGRGEGQHGSVIAVKGHNATVAYPLGEDFSVPSGSEREVSMACTRSGHSPSSWSLDGAQSQSPPLWSSPRWSKWAYNVHCSSEWLFKVVLLLALCKPHLNRSACSIWRKTGPTHMKCCTSPMSWIPECPSRGAGKWRSSWAGGQHMKCVWPQFRWWGWRLFQCMAG